MHNIRISFDNPFANRLMLHISMDGGVRLPSGESLAPLPHNLHKKREKELASKERYKKLTEFTLLFVFVSIPIGSLEGLVLAIELSIEEA